MRNWLALKVEDQLAVHEGLRLELGMCLVLFYAGDGVVGLRDPDWLQVSLYVIIGLFFWYRLVVNVMKSKAVSCHPVTLKYGMS